mmetsp:Transcript_72304/g.156999  ORF Transcript_72304/g.156999 Transcript_72304/m.156999 type:complete len:414 (+) Transcript_72304:1433-2674(+)
MLRGGLRIVEVGPLKLGAEAKQELHSLTQLLELRRLHLHRLALAIGHLNVLIVVFIDWPIHGLLLNLQTAEETRQKVLKKWLEVSLEALGNPLGSLLDVLALHVVRLKLRLHHLRDCVLCIRQEFLLPDRNTEQGHALEGLASKTILILGGRLHDEVLQHGHDFSVILGEVLFYHAGDDSDGGDRLFADTPMLRRLELVHEFHHEALCVRSHESLVQLLSEGDKRRHGHRSDAVYRVVHLHQKHRHELLVPGLLEMGRLIVRKLPDGVQRLIPNSRMVAIYVLNEQLCHLIDVLFLLYVLHGLLHGRQGSMLCLPLLLLHVGADHLEKHCPQRLHRHGLRDAIDSLFSSMEKLILILISLLVIHALSPDLEFLLSVLNLQHELHADLDTEGSEGRQGLRQPLAALLQEGDEPL